MSHFRYIAKKTDARTSALTEERFRKIVSDKNVRDWCDSARKAHLAGDKAAYQANKDQLPMAFWCGYDEKGQRGQEHLSPTQFFIIDIDHARMAAADIYADLCRKLRVEMDTQEAHDAFIYLGIYYIHETPSGGLRMVVHATQNLGTIGEHQQWLNEKLGLEEYGDFDKVVKDLSRGSFMVKAEWTLFLEPAMFGIEARGPIKGMGAKATGEEPKGGARLPEVTDEMRAFCFHDKKVAEIAGEYITDQGGVPEEGLRHAFYNDLVKNFRSICNNDPRLVFAVLPLCEGTPERRWSQCASICKTNNTSLIPKDFYLWMKKRGYIQTKKDKGLVAYLESETSEHQPTPALPPVFRELCAICPPDFVYPTIVALLPVMGTLSSYVRADYIDLVEQSPTFFSCVWAPPGCGKSFAKRLVDLLMKKIRLRDELNDMREQLWLIDNNTKASDEKGKELPHVMVRILPAINSLPEFLEKMRDNHGYHMFTMAEEVDTFKKGSSSGGADKSDLFRTAWDNSEYGQSFKSTNTFKGLVRVYYNILLTGTPGAVKKYYSNVEDGMVTRISICEIENQQFAKFQAWKKLSKKQLEVIEKYVARCDENTYKDPVDISEEEARLYYTNSKNYDANVKWKFALKEKQKVDMQWVFPTILDWLEGKRIEASLANDVAKDVFRRRCAVKGFRLALLCTTCWENVREREMKVIKDFVRWFMDRDLEESMKMFGEKYNKLQEDTGVETSSQKSLFDSLDNEFTKNDVTAKCIELGIKTRVKQIIYRWKKDKAITKLSNDNYKKVSNDRNKPQKNEG